MEFVLILAFAIIVGVVYLLVQFWWVFLLLFVLLILGLIVYYFIHQRTLKRLQEEVVHAEIINSEPIVERVAEKTGYSIGYGRHLSSREYFRYKDVVTGHKIKFVCYYRNGEHDIRTCKQGSAEYNVLISKTK